MMNELPLTRADIEVSDACAQGWYGIMTRTAVFVAWQEFETNRATHVGSGVAMRTSGGHAFVLTAAHNLDALHAHQNGVIGSNSLRPAIPLGNSSMVKHPDQSVDVGIIVPSYAVRAELLKVAEPFDQVVPKFEPMDGDCYQVIGFPAGNVRVDEPNRIQGFKSFTWLCDQSAPPERRGDGRIQFKWADEGLPLRRVEDDVLMGTVAATPYGMSGGPLWRHQDVVTESKLWLQSHACKIVGIQSAWNEAKRQLYLEPSDRWYEWFTSIAEQIDREMPIQGSPL